MENLCELLQKEQLQVPLIVGGATTSTVHTAVKLAPKYNYCVVSGGTLPEQWESSSVY